MFEMRVSVSKDRKELSLDMPNMSQPLNMSALELDEVIRQLAWIRASMLPEHEQVDLRPTDLVSAVPAVRWQATEDTIPGQSRLHLLHPGYGWIWIPLDRETFDGISQSVRLFLQAPSSRH